MKTFLTLQSVDAVLRHIEEFPPLPEENVSLEQAQGRRLAKAWIAPHDLPGFDRSTVDGYAVQARDVFGAQEGSPALLECVGDCPMGGRPDFALEPGQTARILTGGMLPQGADCVVMVEYSRPVGENLVELIHTQAPGDNVLMHDEDAAQGAELIPRGRLLRPQEIGLLAAFGERTVTVRRPARVAVLSTGDEVVPLEQAPAPGQVRDVNSYSLSALCRGAGAETHRSGLVHDDPVLLRAAVDKALMDHDVVVVSGGSSAGMRDHTVDVFTSVAESRLLVHGVAISPGKPFILARAGNKCLMGLPGHVTSALICARTFLVPLLHRLQGRTDAGKQPGGSAALGVGGEIMPSISARLARAVASAQGRRDFIRVRLEPRSAGLEGTTPDHGAELEPRYTAYPILGPSGLLSGLVAADGLVVCPENREGLAAGELVTVELLS